jgi:hypothetical protein
VLTLTVAVLSVSPGLIHKVDEATGSDSPGCRLEFVFAGYGDYLVLGGLFRHVLSRGTGNSAQISCTNRPINVIIFYIVAFLVPGPGPGK